MKNSDTSILSLDLASRTPIAFGYRALELLTRRDDVRILEASPAGGGTFLILAAGEERTLQELMIEFRRTLDGASPDLVNDHELLGGASTLLLEALYSLTGEALDESLVVIECQTISALLSISNLLIEAHALKPIEIKVHRGPNSGGYAFFTGSSAACGPAAEDARTHLRASLRVGAVEVIEAPSAEFRRHFNP